MSRQTFCYKNPVSSIEKSSQKKAMKWPLAYLSPNGNVSLREQLIEASKNYHETFFSHEKKSLMREIQANFMAFF
jgi:hypothetical protein